MTRIKFDSTISLAHVLQVIVLLLALWGATVRLEGRLSALETKIDPVWKWFTARGPAADSAR